MTGKRAGCVGRGIRVLALALIPISYLLLTYAGWWTAPVASALIVLLARLAWPDRWAEALGLRIPPRQIGVSLALLCVVAGAASGLIAATARAETIAFMPVWESRAWASALVHTVGQTLNEEMVLGALLLRAVRSRLRSIHPLAVSAGVALVFSLAHYAFYRARPSWSWNYGTLSVATLASLCAIGVARNNCILSTRNVGYAWAIHLGWNAVFMNGTYRWPGSHAELAEPAMFNAIVGHTALVALSAALMGLSLLLFLRRRAPDPLAGTGQQALVPCLLVCQRFSHAHPRRSERRPQAGQRRKRDDDDQPQPHPTEGIDKVEGEGEQRVAHRVAEGPRAGHADGHGQHTAQHAQ